MSTLRKKIRGMFLGVGIGDSLGMPVETWDKDRIAKAYPEGVREYKVPSGHKWFKGQPAGVWTDDTQLTIATARGLIDAKDFDLEIQGKAAVVAMKEAMKEGDPGGSGVPGWGYTTVKAVRNLANNIPWTESGKTTDPNLGHGNGVVMRQAPIAAWSLTKPGRVTVFGELHAKLIQFSAMTHYTQQSALATLTHHYVLCECLLGGKSFTVDRIFSTFYRCKAIADALVISPPLLVTKINMWEEFDKVRQSKGWDSDKIIAEFGGGSCNVGHSLPFCYAFFVNNHGNIQVLYDVVEAGGDTDTNASIVGGMFGALHGEKIFPDHLVDGLVGKEKILQLADEFCETFRVQ